ncbi:MAG: glutaminyl-peptide cyclotransferase [Verrucomicrobiota bacterium]
MKRPLTIILSLGCTFLLGSCGDRITEPQRLDYELVGSVPHDPKASTQGLLLHGPLYYESTGGYGQSTLRRVDSASGQVLKQRRLPKEIFGEGIALREDRLYQLEWKGGRGFIYERESFDYVGDFHYEGEGWGLAWDGAHFILSDGTETLRFLNPDSFQVARTLTVRDHRGPVDLLNELEWIDGKLYANRWHTDDLLVINPKSGRIEAKLNLASLGLPRPSDPESVLNGIAFDPKTNLLHVTGKRWPRVYLIRVRK